jgi:arabinofuranosyltransferase
MRNIASASRTIGRSLSASIAVPMTLVVLGILFSALVLSIYGEHLLDDAMISFRYALRLSEHYPIGFWNREGPPVEGYTSALWVWLLSFAGPDVSRITTAAKAYGLICYLAIPASLLFLSRTETSPSELDPEAFKEACRYSAVATLVYIPLAWYATTGMETTLYALLITLVVFAPIRVHNVIVISLLNLLLITVRPDGILFAGGSAAYFLIFDSANRKRRVFILAYCLTMFGVVLVSRYLYFGEPMPNTYYAKAGGVGLMHVEYGLQYVGAWAISHWYLLIPLGLLTGRLLRRPHDTISGRFPVAVGAGLLVYAALIIRVGGDNYAAFPLWRHAVQLMPLIFFLTFYALAVLRANRGIKLSMLLCIAALPVFMLLPTSQSKLLQEQAREGLHRAHFFSNRPFNPFFVWMRSISSDNTLISTSLAGELPLAVDATCIDSLGLNDEFIAHHGTFDPRGPVDSKSDMNYVISRRPDIIEGYMSATSILQGKKYSELIAVSRRTQMLQTLLSNHYFKENYMFVTNAPYQYFDRALFVHKDFLQKSVRSGIPLEAVPVSQAIKYD